MGLETATYVDELNASNPIHATDQVSEGDDHIRLVKSTLLNSFPNISGAMTASHSELNFLDGAEGVTGSGLVVLSTGPTFQGTANFTDIFAGGDITGSIAASNIDSGTMVDARIAASNVTQHEAAITITESQISDLGSYLSSGDVATTLDIGNADTTLSRDAAGQLAVEGSAVFTHDDAALTSGKIFFSNGVEPTTEGANGDIFLVY